MSNELAVRPSMALDSSDYLMPAAPVSTMLAVYQAKKEFIEQVLAKGTDYGVIPGAGDKPALFKPGAEKMASMFGLAPLFEDVATVEDWTGAQHNGEPFFFYRQKCKLFRGERLVGSADGSCNSWEKKYRYRSAQRVCPVCGQSTIIKGKPEFGGGYICFAKKGGCGAKFKIGDKSIEDQEVGQVKNPDIADATNTILKMAQKRALVAAVLIATNVSDYFTQDIEDYTDATFTDAPVTPHNDTNPARESSAADAPEGPKQGKSATQNTETTKDVGVVHSDANTANSPVLTLEEAFACKTSDGKLYADVPSSKFPFMEDNILKKLESDLLKPDARLEYMRKLTACRMIMAHNQEVEAKAANELV